MNLADDLGCGLVYSSAQVLLLFADTEEDLEQARVAASRAGCRIAAEGPLTGAIERFEAQIAVDSVLLCARKPSEEFYALLKTVGDAARATRMTGVVVAPRGMIDPIAGMNLPPEMEHLCDPTASQLESALARAAARAPSMLHDIGRAEATLLHQLSEDVARIASVLASLSDEGAGESADDDEEPVVEASFVRGIIRARRLRDQFFRGELFADPAFDALLDLYAARLEGRRVAVSSLCIAAAVPSTTALRWIRALTDKGLFVRTADPEDGRRIYIGLSDDTARAMGRYLGAVQRNGLPAI